jgi:hypothetical protein
MSEMGQNRLKTGILRLKRVTKRGIGCNKKRQGQPNVFILVHCLPPRHFRMIAAKNQYIP